MPGPWPGVFMRVGKSASRSFSECSLLQFGALGEGVPCPVSPSISPTCFYLISFSFVVQKHSVSPQFFFRENCYL